MLDNDRNQDVSNFKGIIRMGFIYLLYFFVYDTIDQRKDLPSLI